MWPEILNALLLTLLGLTIAGRSLWLSVVDAFGLMLVGREEMTGEHRAYQTSAP